MVSWIIKILLKFMKPFAKAAIVEGILSSLLSGDGAESDDEFLEDELDI